MDLQKAKEIVQNGGVVIFPTDTAFGIGCRIDAADAVKRLFEIKQRSENQATPVLIDSVAMAQRYTSVIGTKVKKLMEVYWPGALTIILPVRAHTVSSLVRGGSHTVGLRIPNHEIPLELIRAIGVPIIGTSANFHGEKTPYVFTDLESALMEKVDMVIPGECSLKQASTIIDCSEMPWKIVREGAIQLEL